MSRSRKKHTILKDGGRSSKSDKQIANKIFRSKIKDLDYLPQKSLYKRFYEQYDINDWIHYWPLEEAIKDYETAEEDSYIKKHYKTLEDFIKYWKKLMFCK